MAAFTSPIEDPATWTLSLPGPETVAPGLRYAGERLFALRAERAVPRRVVVPALGVLRQVVESASGRAFVEVQVNPFPIRRVAQAVVFGLPTFYVVFDAGTAPAPFADGDIAPAGEVLGELTAITILCAGQDRVARDPALWAAQLLEALVAGGGTTSEWQPFADTVASQTATGTGVPVLVLDHTGRPSDDATVEVRVGAMAGTATLDPADGGDLQRAVARLNAADPVAMPIASLFGGGATSATLAAPPGAAGDLQLARLEDALHAAGAIAVTPDARHVTLTDLHEWFAPQFAARAEPLAHFTRGNRLTPLVNGPELFDDLFRRLHDAALAGAEGGFHLAGWAMDPQTRFTKRRAGDPADLPLTLEEAATLIGAAGGATRFLPARFYQLDASDAVTPGEIVALTVIVAGLLIAHDIDFLRTDAGGGFALIALWLANAVLVAKIIGEDGRPLERNRGAVSVLDLIAGSACVLSPYPARIEDNPVAPAQDRFPFNLLFPLIRHFGIHHQKFAIVRAGATRIGYCGGIDVNPDRLDDARHLIKSPFHDVHARVDGPAVRDLELSFVERWSVDGGAELPAFDPAPVADLGTPGSDAVQVARTYFRPRDPARALPFAPNGDRTIANTLLAAIEAAREFIFIEEQYFTPPAIYSDLLVAKVRDRAIRRLVIVLPGLTDQPFGERPRSDLIAALRAADAGAGIVQIGYPRRHYTVPDNELRASSGKCLLMNELQPVGGLEPAVFLAPPDRLPAPPFWLAIDGELMYAFNESVVLTPDPGPAAMLPFQVLRGVETRLVSGGASAASPKPRHHAPGAAATVVDLADVYVHAKMMIVDDVFLGIGSANLNRRGLFHDGEINVFTVPQALKAGLANPIAGLRRRLWAEMLDLPLATAGPLLEDPLSATRLFERSPLAGNRFTDIEAYPSHLMFDATTGDGVVAAVLTLVVGGLVAIDHEKLFDAVVDPTSALETA